MTGYERRILSRLSDVLNRNADRETRELDDLRLIVFSDHHRGQGDGADDFRECRSIYHGALGYYLELDYELLLLGDVEELWENHAHEVVAGNHQTLELERRFIDRGGLRRFWGNHDDLWANPDAVKRHLGEYLVGDNGGDGASAQLHEALAFDLTRKGEEIGTLLFTHGHQGSGLSDRFSKASRWFLRWLWRPLQRLLHLQITTPAQDYALRKKHEVAMHRWAASQDALVLVTGHTHHPVFSSESHGQLLKAELEELRQRYVAAETPEEIVRIRQMLARRASEVEWVVAQADGDESALPPGGQPCFFNAGCCSFSDGTITGIEIVRGEIRLIRWSDRGGEPERRVVRKARLRRVFERCRKS